MNRLLIQPPGWPLPLSLSGPTFVARYAQVGDCFAGFSGHLPSVEAATAAGTVCAPSNGTDANAQANQAQLHPWEGNQTGWRPYGAAVGEVYPAAPGGFVGPNGYTNGYSGDYVVVPVVPVAPDYTYGYSPAPAYGGYYVVP